MTAQTPKTGPGGKPGPGQLATLQRFMRGRSFVALVHNPDNDEDRRYEAWAYRGPLDFDQATPVHFGLGKAPAEALEALNYHLQQKHKQPIPANRPAETTNTKGAP